MFTLYHYLISGLPEISPDMKKLPFTGKDFRERIENSLTDKDMRWARHFYLRFDHHNLIHLLYQKDKPWEPRANYSRAQLELLLDKKSFDQVDMSVYPRYWSDFIQHIHQDPEGVNEVTASRMLSRGYYDFLDSHGNEFINKIADYERNIANIAIALNARRHELNPEQQFIGNNEVTEALKKSRAVDFGLSARVEYMEEIIQIFQSEKLEEREMKLDMHKWKYLDSITFFNYFTIEKVLAFVLKLFIVERWYALDTEQGRKMFKELFNELKSGFEFPREYTINYGKKR